MLRPRYPEAPMSTVDPFAAPPDFDDVRAAHVRIRGVIVRTPVLRNDTLNELIGAELFFKCENLQRAGAFKFRGASNAVAMLSDEQAARGVVTQSSGNHGAAVALACRLRGIPATVVVPAGAPRIKREAIASHGARIVDCETIQASRDAATARVLEETGGSLIHPYNDARVMAGQGTATLELLEDVPDLDIVIAPVSGGGLLSGTALAAHGINLAIEVWGAEPAGARDAHDSLESGNRITGRKPDTICDGLRAELGPLTFAVLREHCRRIVLVDDVDTIAAMRLIWDRLKVVVEPSAAVTLAALVRTADLCRGRRIGVILSGGNLDLDRLPWQG